MSTCPAPLVHKGSCASDLRALCSADSPARTRAMMYAFTPGVCGGNPGNLTDPMQDIAKWGFSARRCVPLETFFLTEDAAPPPSPAPVLSFPPSHHLRAQLPPLAW